MTAFEDVAASH